MSARRHGSLRKPNSDVATSRASSTERPVALTADPFGVP
jgi:hypothetical protein